MINKRIINILACLFLIQGSCYGITEIQARGSAFLLGLWGAAMVSRTENPTFIFTVGTIVGALGYTYLQKYTPAFPLNEVQNRLDKMQHHELVSNFSNIEEKIKKEIHQDPNYKSITAGGYKEEYNTRLIKEINTFYPPTFDEPFSLVTAMQKLTLMNNDINSVQNLLDTAECLAECLNEKTILAARLNIYKKNISAALNTIDDMRSFRDQKNQWEIRQQKAFELKIKQQQAAIGIKAAQEIEEKVTNISQKPKFEISGTCREFLSFCFGLTFNIRSN